MADSNASQLTTPSIGTAPTDEEFAALVKKHRAKIDPILRLESESQQQAVRQLGIDPQALEEHYKDFQVKYAELRHRDHIASKNTSALGWASFAAALAGTGSLAWKNKISKSKLVQGFVVALSAVSAAFAGIFMGSNIFGNKIRRESKQLNIEARHALERELAVAFENKERAPAELSAASGTNPGIKVAPRNPSYTAQAALDKTAAADNTVQQRT